MSGTNKTLDTSSVQTDGSYNIDVSAGFGQESSVDNPAFTPDTNGTSGIKSWPDSSTLSTPTQNGMKIPKKTKEEEKKEEEDDPWALPELKDTDTPWSDLSTAGKCQRVFLNAISKPILLLGLLYLFICSLDFLSSAFRLLGGKTAGEVIGSSIVATNPICGVMVGILATVLVQSSSTTTSIVVSMVASGILKVEPAIPMIMGANIGTSVTNTIVSVFHLRDRGEFRRAFAGATVHDMFNWLAVLVLLPIELISGYLYRLTDAIVRSMHLQTNEEVDVELLKVITKPFTELVVQIDKGVIKAIAQGDEDAEQKSLVKEWCDGDEIDIVTNVTKLTNVTRIINNETVVVEEEVVRQVFEKGTEDVKCSFLFSNTGLSDAALGTIILILALVILCVCLVLIVKLLHSLLKGQFAALIKKVINSDFPGRLAWLTGYIAILVGAGLTMLVQSSSIFTSAMTPLVGIGVVSIERMYPFTLGANVGTTFTAILAALASSGGKLASALQIALCHFFFNITAIIIWYPVPIMRRVPIKLAKINGNTTAKYRWFAFFYLFLMFFIFPAALFGLSLAGWIWLGIFGGIFILLFTFVVIVNLLQSNRPGCLPKVLRSWDFLPTWMHSLEPLDGILRRIFHCCNCCARCRKQTYALRDPESNVNVNVVFQPDEQTSF
ncbi:sodium-dependent phosphate transport protein 2B-like [Ptychodera flava]|uniref:sodium-dependent phosphate transport protein 2B-like n=1 Tax=Ptychodera flava TaxID=63121 RepID=UPI00396A8D3A